MKVDMSPEAVTQRLRTVGELWVLCAKLMNSKKVKPESVKEDELPDNPGDPRPARKQDRV